MYVCEIVWVHFKRGLRTRFAVLGAFIPMNVDGPGRKFETAQTMPQVVSRKPAERNVRVA